MAILDGVAKKGAGRVFREASDYILGKNYQRIKLIFGADSVVTCGASWLERI